MDLKLELNGATARYLLNLIANAIKNGLFPPFAFNQTMEEFLAQLPHSEEKIMANFANYEISLSIEADKLYCILLLYGDIYALDETNYPVGPQLFIATSKALTKED